MGRLVPQMSVKTVINNVTSGKQDQFWIAGTKFEKWSVGDTQEIDIKYAKPQEVTVEVDVASWHSNSSIHKLIIRDFNGREKVSGWQVRQYGIKFFRDKASAERYFLEQSHKLFKMSSPMLEIHRELHKKVSYEDPDFLQEIG